MKAVVTWLLIQYDRYTAKAILKPNLFKGGQKPALWKAIRYFRSRLNKCPTTANLGLVAELLHTSSA
ncbi:MAG TPA: hypothetical protein DCW52_11730 [Gammaproteobacteria bacterium]|nr:hypothetical protein [Gammaproteobacteria bacterium]